MTSGFYNYLQLIKNSTLYAKRMSRLSNQIFGEPVRPTKNKSLKIVSLLSPLPYHKNDEYVNYYPRHVETKFIMKHLRDYGLFRDEHEDFKEEMKRLNELRGKVDKVKIPGQGKKKKE